MPLNPDESIETHYCDPPDSELGDGVEFNAITFFGNQNGLAVGDRGFAIYPNSNLIAGVEIIENILYRFVGDQLSADFGRASSDPQPTKTADLPTEKIFEGAGTDIRERGEVLTAPRLEATYASGSRLQPPNQDPALAQSDIVDGQYFTVVDGANQVTFEFDTGPEVLQNIDVQNNVSIRDGNFFQLDDNLFQIDTGSVIDIFGSGAMVDGAVVTVNDGRFSESFEFRWDRGNATPPRTDPNATVIAVGAGTTPLQIASDLAQAINATALNITAHAPGSRVSMEGDSAVSVSPGANGVRVRGMGGGAPILQAVDGSQIKDGDNFYLNSSAGFQAFEFDTGYTLVTPVRYLLQMPLLGGRAVADGEKFTIGNSVTGANLTFEFDRDGRASVSPAQVISYAVSDSADQLAAKVVAVIGNPAFALNLAPTAQSGGVVHLGSTRDNSLNASAAPSIQQLGVAGGITDGERFTLRDGFRTIVFEMDSDGSVGDPAYVPIAFSQVATHDQIAANIATAIQAQPLGLTPTYLGDGQIHLGGDDGVPAGSRNHTLDTTTAPNISDVGRPGVSDPNAVPIDFVIPGPSFTVAQVVNRIDVAIQQASANKQIEQGLPGNQLWDGRTFAVVSHGRTYTFEYNDVRNGPAGVTLGNFRIDFDPGDANANPAIPATASNVMATRIENAVEAAIPSASQSRPGERGHPRPRRDRGIRRRLHDPAGQRPHRGQRQQHRLPRRHVGDPGPPQHPGIHVDRQRRGILRRERQRSAVFRLGDGRSVPAARLHGLAGEPEHDRSPDRHAGRGGRRSAHRLRGQQRRRLPGPDQFPRCAHGGLRRHEDAGPAAGLEPSGDQRLRRLVGQHPHPGSGERLAVGLRRRPQSWTGGRTARKPVWPTSWPTPSTRR